MFEQPLSRRQWVIWPLPLLSIIITQIFEIIVLTLIFLFYFSFFVEILAVFSKLQQLCAIENNATKHKPVNKQANLPLTELTNLDHLYNSGIRLPAAAAAMVQLVNRLSNTKCTQSS